MDTLYWIAEWIRTLANGCIAVSVLKKLNICSGQHPSAHRALTVPHRFRSSGGEK